MESDYPDWVKIDYSDKGSITDITVNMADVDPKDDTAIIKVAELICSTIPPFEAIMESFISGCDEDHESEVHFHVTGVKIRTDISPIVSEQSQQNLKRFKDIVEEAKNYSKLQYKHHPYINIFRNEIIKVSRMNQYIEGEE